MAWQSTVGPPTPEMPEGKILREVHVPEGGGCTRLCFGASFVESASFIALGAQGFGWTSKSSSSRGASFFPGQVFVFAESETNSDVPAEPLHLYLRQDCNTKVGSERMATELAVG